MTAVQRSRVAVIGRGVMGSAVAWAMAKAGADVVLFEQFEPGETDGASHGSSRIFRYVYLEQSYIQLADPTSVAQLTCLYPCTPEQFRLDRLSLRAPAGL